MIDPITGSLAAAGLLSSIAGGIFSSRKAKKERRRQQELLRQQRAADEAWYARNYSQDFLNSGEAQDAIRRVKEAWGERMQEARARQAITGGTPEQMAQVEKVGAKAMGDTVASLAAKGDAIKRGVDAQKNEMDRQANAQEAQMSASAQEAAENAKANAIGVGLSALQLGASALSGGSKTSPDTGVGSNAATTDNTSSGGSAFSGGSAWYDELATGADKWDLVKSGKRVVY